MLLIYAGVKVVSAVVEWRQWDSLRFGEYGEANMYVFISLSRRVVPCLLCPVEGSRRLRSQTKFNFPKNLCIRK